MKRFYELKCDDCGTVVEKWIPFEEIPETVCPRCRKKGLRKLISSFMTGASCRTGFKGFRG